MNKIVVISGGSSGLGKELLELFSAAGDTAISLSRSNPHNHAHFFACDVSCPDSCNAAVEQIKQAYGRIDMLINNAGLGISGATEHLPDEEVKKVLDVDYLGALRLSRAALKIMPSSGRIIMISSACALFALPYRGVYCSAKAAMNMLGYSMRMELSAYGVKVVTICPGEIKTEFTANRLKFNETDTKYGNSPQLSAEAIDKNVDKRMDCRKAAKKIYKIAARKNGALYIVGAKYKFFNFIQRLLPVRWFLAILNKIFNKKDKK
ncbi:MAG: SDR family NAD(P)-dependent oxidoreductase [Firmicutes bacterium]|nr:SDR family NAD(P)-dependent oxidoreductase [Bacillota bacterium]